MTRQPKLDQVFQFIDQTTVQLQKILRVSYHEALSENILNILQQKTYVEDDFPTPEQVAQLDKEYQTLTLQDYPLTVVKQAVELAIVKAQKVDQTEVNLLMTPDAIGVITALIVAEIFPQKTRKPLKVVDPCMGSGNLLLTVAQQLQTSTDLTFNLTGLDNNDSLLALATAYMQAIQQPVDLYQQDAVAYWLQHDYDLALADLPVGYYPVDENVVNFKTRAEEGHSYAHHLIIEQTMKNIRPGGIGLFVVPAQVFQTEQAPILAKWMVESVYLQAVLSLPSSLFTSAAATKSIIVLQRHGEQAQQAPEVLIGEIDDLNKSTSLVTLRNQLRDWSQKTFNWGTNND
ncbi:class I SAM-dependent methyltransferase [Lactobacillus sp. DCY120]|uniref:Class I SAM-dependent methyltransferase n=1 Tax=Bombilactobacillus apium TaxID=2675299 RepID=A0A850R1V1_9LACO|nr:class I SAM-dependent methyltransferase [Bombilactobacillus apium]NVY97099.1 class I SAM-dependent methyltransferase [Bombilactobacillus apium]